ncbi:MAG: hypothetical protein ACOCRX_06700 [Candidatus Woesearchaeota archaeon]
MVFSNKRNGFIFIFVITLSILFSFYMMDFGWSELYSNDNLEQLRLSDGIYDSCSNLRYNFAEINIDDSNKSQGYFNSSIDLVIENKGNQDISGVYLEIITTGDYSFNKNVILEDPITSNNYHHFEFNSYLNCDKEIQGCKIDSINIIPVVEIKYEDEISSHLCDDFEVKFSRDDLSVSLGSLK